MRHVGSIGILLCGLAACGLKAPPVPPATATPEAALNPEAVAGVTDTTLRQLLNDQWEHALARHPFHATELGEHRFDALTEDLSAESVAADRALVRQWLDRGSKIHRDALTPSDRTTLELFTWQMGTERDLEVCRFEQWNLSATSNPVATFNYLPELQTVTTPADAHNLLARYAAAPRYIDQAIANLREGLKGGWVENAHSVGLSVEMVDKQLAQPLAEWPMMAPATAEHPDWSADELAAFRKDVTSTVDGDVRAAFTRYRDFLKDQVLPVARPDDKSGVKFLPEGEACYAAAIGYHTSLHRSADDVHQIGLDELGHIHAEMQDLGEKLFGTRDLQAIFERLRTDRSLYFSTGEEIHAKAEDALARSRAAIPQWFGRLPKTECVVRDIPDYQAPYTYIAYYQPAHLDGTKPGEFFVNTYAPETRPKYQAEVLAFHESIPGHHLQISITQEMPALPAFRKNQDMMTVYVEGWALYTERLADEMGLYSGDVDRMGMLAFDSWRASRLVVDSGIHHLGWSRQQAVDFMKTSTPLAENNIDNEVDRYITWPGQALGYKTGQMEIWRLRREAEQTLGPKFDIRGFHDVVLGSGPVTLPMLQEQVHAWVQKQSEG